MLLQKVTWETRGCGLVGPLYFWLVLAGFARFWLYFWLVFKFLAGFGRFWLVFGHGLAVAMDGPSGPRSGPSSMVWAWSRFRFRLPVADRTITCAEVLVLLLADFFDGSGKFLVIFLLSL